MKTKTLCGLLLLSFLGSPALADPGNPVSSTDSTSGTSLDALKARIDALEQQVSEMTPPSGHAGHFLSSTGLPLHGFISVGASESSAGDPKRLQGFELNNIDLYMTPSAGDHVRGLVEMNFEIDEAGAIATDLERLQLGYVFSGDTTLWLGRFHVPYGYWNTAHHHGAALQTSINRPRFIDFEDKGGILPAHAVGLWLTGRRDAGSAGIGYNLWLANGGRIQTTSDNDNVLDFNQFTDNNAQKMAGFSLAWMSGGDFDGFQIGVHGYADSVTTYAPDNVSVLDRTHVRMGGAFVYYSSERFEAQGEYYRFNNDVVTAAGPAVEGTHSSNAGFFQLAYTEAAFTPYVRTEAAHLDNGDAYFNSMNSGVPYTRNSVGVRYQVNAQSVLKLEAGRTHEKAVDLLDVSGPVPATRALADARYNRVQLQGAIAF